MRVICTKTGDCHLYVKPCNDCVGGEFRCMYHTRISEPIEVEDWPGDEDHLLAALARDKAVVDYASHVVWQFGTLLDGFAYLASRFEEVCGERADLQEAFFHDAEVFCLPCPGDPEDYTFVRAHYRPKPRRSKSVKTEATPTTEIPRAVSESPASLQGQGEAFKGEWTCLNCCAYWEREYNYCPTCDGIVVPAEPRGLAVCRWEVGRWA